MFENNRESAAEGYFANGVVGEWFVFDKMLKNRYLLFISSWVLILRFCEINAFKASALP